MGADNEPGPPVLTPIDQGDVLSFPGPGKFEVPEVAVPVVVQRAPVRIVTDKFTAADRMREARFVRYENVAFAADLPVASNTFVAVLTKPAAFGSAEYKLNTDAGMVGAPVSIAYVGKISADLDTTDPTCLIPLQYMRKKNVHGALATLYDKDWCSWEQKDANNRDTVWSDEVLRGSLIVVDMKVNKVTKRKKRNYEYVEFKSLCAATLKTLGTVPQAKVGAHTRRKWQKK